MEYPHTSRRHVLVSPLVTAKALDVAVKPNLSVGYVMGVGDEVPAALEQLGVKVTLIGSEELAWGDLSKYDVVMTGVRAYERRLDLRAYNSACSITPRPAAPSSSTTTSSSSTTRSTRPRPARWDVSG